MQKLIYDYLKNNIWTNKAEKIITWKETRLEELFLTCLKNWRLSNFAISKKNDEKQKFKKHQRKIFYAIDLTVELLTTSV